MNCHRVHPERQSMRKLLLIMAIAWVATAAAAQSADRVVYAWKAGDIWKFDLADNSAAQITRWGYTGGPILAPDGRRLAYLSTAPEFIAQFNAGTAAQSAGTAPGNIWIMDIASERLTLIAAQSDAGGGAAGILRSPPAWSPDGRKLAWLELDAGAQDAPAALKLHDVAANATSLLADNVALGSQGDSDEMPILRWGLGGIAKLRIENITGAQHIDFYDPASGAPRSYELTPEPSGALAARDFVWADHLGSSLVALQIQDFWEIINPHDGTRLRLSDPPRLKNRASSGAMQLIPAAVANAAGDWDIHWYATTGDNLQSSGYVSPGVKNSDVPALSPDGVEMAWRGGDGVEHWRISMAEGNRVQASAIGHLREFPIPEPVSVVWAPTEWVTTGSVAGAPVLLSASVNCGLLPLLTAGQQAIVGPDLSLRVRSAARTSGEVTGSLEGGAVVTIDEGPVCADGYNWYAVSNDDISGWTAEGGGGYWLLYHVACSDSPATRLTTTMTATATGDRIVNIRDGAGTAITEVVWAVAAGDEFVVTGLPQCGGGGLRWYPVRIDEQLGWIAEGQSDFYWIEPIES